MSFMPKKYVELAEQIATNLEDWANPKGAAGLRNEYVGHLKPIGIALEGFEELLDWLRLNRPEDGEYVQSAYDRLVSQAKLDDHLLESLYEGEEVFSEEAALSLAFTLRGIVKMAEGVAVEEPSTEDEMSRRLSKSIELLKEFRSAFMSLATVESEGKFPSVFLEDVGPERGATGILQLNSHPRTGRISCRFKPQFGGEELSWTHYETEYDLSEYERLLFSTWSYDTGYALDRNEKSEAVWYIDDQAIADRLEDIAEKVDELLNTIDDPLSTFYAVISTVKNHKPKWKPGRVSWYYIKELDERIRELELTYKRLSIGTEAKPKIEPGKGILLESIHRAYEDFERLVETDENLEKLSFEETAYAEAVVIDYLTEKFGEQDDALGNWPSDWHECPEAFDLYKAKIREFRAGQAKASLDEVRRIAESQPEQKNEPEGEQMGKRANSLYLLSKELSCIASVLYQLPTMTVLAISKETERGVDVLDWTKEVVKSIKSARYMALNISHPIVREVLAVLVDLDERISEAQCSIESAEECLDTYNTRQIAYEDIACLFDDAKEKYRNILMDLATKLEVDHLMPNIELVKRQSTNKHIQKSKYTPEKIKNMQTSYDKHIEENKGVKYAWECVAEEHSLKTGKAAEMAVRRHQKKNK